MLGIITTQIKSIFEKENSQNGGRIRGKEQERKERGRRENESNGVWLLGTKLSFEDKNGGF